MKNSVNAKNFKANYRRYTGSNPSQAGDEQGLDARVNRTRLDETFPVGPYSGRWESSHKYSSK